jgi:hypothetical protein
MKTIARNFLLISLFAASIPACKKNSSSSTASTSTLTLSKTSVKMGEPLIVQTSQTGSNLVTKWSVSPSVNSWISSTNLISVILFSSPGTYQITANYYTDSSATISYGSSSSPVTVTDSIYIDSMATCDVIAEVPINTGDQITLTPISFSDTGLVLLAHTQQTYGVHSPSLGIIELSDSSDGVYDFGFGGVTEYPCNGSGSPAAVPATGSVSFTGTSLTPGTHNLTIGLNGVAYQGSLVVTSTSCSFTWNYSSGIIISPLTIQIQ